MELLKGRDSLGDAALEAGLLRWASEGRQFLYDHFGPETELEFITTVNVAKRTITLQVIKLMWEQVRPRQAGGPMYPTRREVFTSEEKAETFVTPTTLTKIILVA